MAPGLFRFTLCDVHVSQLKVGPHRILGLPELPGERHVLQEQLYGKLPVTFFPLDIGNVPSDDPHPYRVMGGLCRCNGELEITVPLLQQGVLYTVYTE